MGNAESAGVDLGDSERAQVAVGEGDEAVWTQFSGGDDAVGADAAAEIGEALAFFDFDGFHQGAGAVVKATVGKRSRTREEAVGSCVVDPDLESDFMAAPRLVGADLAPIDDLVRSHRAV